MASGCSSTPKWDRHRFCNPWPGDRVAVLAEVQGAGRSARLRAKAASGASTRSTRFRPKVPNRVVGSLGVYPTTSVIHERFRLWEALSVVSKWSFPTALPNICKVRQPNAGSGENPQRGKSLFSQTEMRRGEAPIATRRSLVVRKYPHGVFAGGTTRAKKKKYDQFIQRGRPSTFPLVNGQKTRPVQKWCDNR